MIQVDTDILHSLNGKEKAMNGSKLVKELGISTPMVHKIKE